MDRILTKEEIAELLSAVHEGEIEVDTPEPAAVKEKNVTGFDLIKAQGIGKKRIGNLDIVLDAFDRNCGISLSGEMQRSLSIERTEIATIKFDPFLMELTENSVIGMISLAPLRNGALIIIEPELAFYLVETMLGGREGVAIMSMSRPMTAIELNLLRNPLLTVCKDIQKAFLPIIKLTASLVRVDTDPRMVNIVPGDTEMMVTEHAVTAGKFTGSMKLVFPYPALEPLKDKLKEGVVESMPNQVVDLWFDILAAELVQMRMAIVAQSGEIPISIKKLGNLQAGDILDLTYDPNAPLRILVENKAKFFAQPGIQNGKKAIRITGRIGKGE